MNEVPNTKFFAARRPEFIDITKDAHDGDFHADADYDHALSGTGLGRAATRGSYGVEDPGIPAFFRAELLGRRANDDTWVDCGPRAWLDGNARG